MDGELSFRRSWQRSQKQLLTLSHTCHAQDLYNGTGYHGYWAANFSEIDPHLGTAEELKNLSRELHARGMLLMCDVVANHVKFPSLFSNLSSIIIID